MTKGVLIFAINSTFDYLKSAEVAARQVKKYLGLPVTVVSNEPYQSPYFDTMVADASGSTRGYLNPDGSLTPVTWFNESRTKAYDLSPYDQTLLIDSDYFMFNDSLLPIFDADVDIACYGQINDVTGVEPNQIYISRQSIPMQWATVIYFRKGYFSKAVFDFMQIIQREWKYYALLFGFSPTNFRNDFALSIAIQTLTGYSTKNFCNLPGKLHSIFSNTEVSSVSESEITFRWANQVNKVSGMNIHCMNKEAIPLFYD